MHAPATVFPEYYLPRRSSVEFIQHRYGFEGASGMVQGQKNVQSFCDREWDTWKGDCSGFLKAVAADLGITLSGQANEIIDAMSRAPWTDLGTDGDKAVSYANRGYLVVAGLKATGHGHVAIIVSGLSKPYPIGYWGRFGSAGRKNMPINWSWNRADLPKVRYFAIQP